MARGFSVAAVGGSLAGLAVGVIPGGWRAGGLRRRWRQPRSAAGDDWHNLFITKQLFATLTIELILADLMEATMREMPHLVDREVLEVTNNKFNSFYEEPLASAQRKRWLNSIDFNPAGPFCAIACG